ncbi:copper-binding protein [Amphritea atlantica]|uniref:Copper-binding protein n=1 Tax=Amphritea atlantica TaxID=355243 RepID=A0ABY5GWP1_9GAMM|nr:copper-binding protein [Amphritea atlantica]
MSHNSGSHNAEHSSSKSTSMKMAVEEVVAEGVVKRVLADSNQIMVHHQPIPEWNMSAMQMKFNLADGLSVADFKEGQAIRFRLQQSHMMKFTIVKLLEP